MKFRVTQGKRSSYKGHTGFVFWANKPLEVTALAGALLRPSGFAGHSSQRHLSFNVVQKMKYEFPKLSDESEINNFDKAVSSSILKEKISKE